MTKEQNEEDTERINDELYDQNPWISWTSAERDVEK